MNVAVCEIQFEASFAIGKARTIQTEYLAKLILIAMNEAIFLSMRGSSKV